MARPKATQVTLTGRYQRGLPNRAVREDDYRMRPHGVAENVLGAYFRANVKLDAAPAAAPEWMQNGRAAELAATTLPEYVIPHLIFLQQGPTLVVCLNRVLLLPFTAAVDPATGFDIDPIDTVPPGDYWPFHAVLEDGTVQQRIRIGVPPAPLPNDDVRALLYVIDFTLDA